MKWQPIETAPKDGTRILLWASIETELGGLEEENVAVFARWDWEKWNVTPICYYEINAIDPTHWMPLPEPPTEVE